MVTLNHYHPGFHWFHILAISEQNSAQAHRTEEDAGTTGMF